MLQQMSSPSSAQLGEVATIVRTFEGRVCGDVSSGASSDAAEDFELPHCKIRRNYSCMKCTYYTQNPRAYLMHTRDVHFVRLKIFDCPHCLYASRHYQKLVRHMKMVHGGSTSETSAKIEQEVPTPVCDTVDVSERMEDMVEEIEDNEDIQIDVDEINEEQLERSDDADVEIERIPDRSALDTPKNKGNFFSCDKCNYVTHLRARFTKHVKYHSMPMIKCTTCDFRTPYKWNLDRHMKNHGGSGSFNCSMCNFTADIKQSLTVHEMNHHTPPVGCTVASRRRNRVGASDLALAEAANALLPKEEEGSSDSRSSHSASEMGHQYSEKDIIASNSDSNDASISETGLKEQLSDHTQSNNPNTHDSSQKQCKKTPRPIPQLIPLNASTPNQSKTSPGEPPAKKFKESTIETINTNTESKSDCQPLVPLINAKETGTRKKNESFFDRLKERLLTETGENGSLTCKNCGFESKCLSEHSVHEKNCSSLGNRTTTNTLMSSLSSTRCQNCRHRCKSSADLLVHMKTCRKAVKTEDATYEDPKSLENSQMTSKLEKETEPHPMENVVFVWNNINHDTSKFDTPLDININDDSTLPEMTRIYENDTVDDNESMNLSPSQAVGKNVFKCPHCPFWASTASRFHVHIVGHLNKKPFECSLCKYKSNWRWDITKHIKLKSARDPEHNVAKVLMTDETGRRNYSKYSKFLAMPVLNDNGENEFHYLDSNTTVDASMEVDESFSDANDATNTSTEMQPLNLQTQHTELKTDLLDMRHADSKKAKKTLWKCKKCNYRDPSKEALLEHVREHSRVEGNEDDPKKKPENTPDPSDLAYRCGHCNQLSNWKHVIQRHCRLKHEGVIKVITTVKPKPDPSATNDSNNDRCPKCPYRASDKNVLLTHIQQHQPSSHTIFKCYFCPYYVKEEYELAQHLQIHGVTDPEDYISKAMGCRSPLADTPTILPQAIHSGSTKRHRCTECPYETNSKSQFMYHEQFHRLPPDTPYKCPECNYSVSKRHLLHQHLRVHGIIPKKNETEAELEATPSSQKIDNSNEVSINNLDEIPFVWVSAKNEFHKMYKCRYCSYVNSQKCKIPNHEKIHCFTFENSDVTVYKCLECKFTCDNSVRLAEHSKSHGEIYGRIYCPVEDDIPDEEQVSKLRKVIELEKSNFAEVTPKEEYTINENKEIKVLHFCANCPARYFTESELKVHESLHESSYTYRCKHCDFAVPEEDELVLHNIVHSDEYHTKTKMLKFVHNLHPAYKEPRLELVHCQDTLEVAWVVSAIKNNESEHNIEMTIKKHEPKHAPKQYLCKECPAKFFKSSALSYHVSLHGGEGEHKCKKCSYAVKNVGNLAKHELLHEQENKVSNCDYESGEDMDYKNVPLSGTDLFQRKTEAQKRVLIDKDKLVKPNDHFPPVLQADPQFGYLMHGNPEFIYPTYLKNGRQKEKRYKCHKCPSAFEKREQYKIHLSLHGSKQRYKCELCDYSVKYYANYVQHMRKHQMNDEAQAERKKGCSGFSESESHDIKQEDSSDNIKLAIKTMPKGTPRSDFQQFSIRDQQTLRLLQRRRSINNSGKETNTSEPSPIKERKLHMCLLCPYTNQRQDALSNHYKRHDDIDVLTSGNHKCSYCDLVVVQSHFLREHLKTHFNYHKTLTPECFVANEDVSFTITRMDETSEPVDLKLDFQNMNYKCNEKEKFFVKMNTGELLVE
ncbi:zinc finger protein Xfin [Manduca sexta]|uniref:C2H2-type domain-containing protein n=1 Tax=Manduca sexta TaxID=7130 RepID=A0A921ZJX9_MANSE|nr:zinc finger protein Xfin [Manduca sexta]KAG6459358.1 hypothetical protein O3G_MSEX011340 [Manduca sexta]